MALPPDALAEAFEQVLANPSVLGRWERGLGYRYAGARSSLRLDVAFSEGPSIAESFEPRVRERYGASRGSVGFSAGGRGIRLSARQVSLWLGGALGDEAEWDGGVQDAIVRLCATTLAERVVSVTTEHHSDTPFEEPPPKLRDREASLALLGRLAHASASVTLFAELASHGANPCIDFVLHGTSLRGAAQRHAFSAHAGRAPATWPLEPGEYVVVAELRAYAFPMYRGPGRIAHDALWVSLPRALRLAPGEHARLYASVLGGAFTLTPAERAIFSGEPFPAHLRARQKLSLAVVVG